MNILTVSQLNMYIKSVFDELPPLQNIYISGEISNFKHYYKSGHFYFTLKDSSSQLKCVMFSSDNYKLKFTPEDGMQVICFGQVGVYERDGAYQLYVHDMQPKGVGEISIAFEQLKSKLEKEGLFDEIYKKPIPKYPSKVGVVTSNIGAAIEDIKNVISRRFPLCELVIVPTLVQGDKAPNDISKSIKKLDNLNVDTIIVGRGGGSLEDLAAFNTEVVARAIFECNTPVISAVGHETDYTICDFVSDLRAPTPSAAAELCVPNIENEKIYLNNVNGSLNFLIEKKIDIESNRLNSFKNDSVLSSFASYIAGLNEKIDSYNKEINQSMKKYLDDKNINLNHLSMLLDSLSPLSVLNRGYSIVSSKYKIISNSKDVKTGDLLNIRMSEGNLIVKVIEVDNNGN